MKNIAPPNKAVYIWRLHRMKKFGKLLNNWKTKHVYMDHWQIAKFHLLKAREWIFIARYSEHREIARKREF